jgi:pyruvate kinase
MRKTKIIATLGPATDDPAAMRTAIAAGIDVVRLNFSHGSHELHRRHCRTAREIAAELGRPLAVMIDLQGPKIRTGPVASGTVRLEQGRRFVITTREVPGDAETISTGYEKLPREIPPGGLILLDDGKIRLRVERIDGDDVVTRVLHGGELTSNKAINIPGARISAPSLTEKDHDDLRFALTEMQVDYVALSFVRRAQDIADLKSAISRLGGDANVVAKIEKPEAVDRIGDILAALELGDALMVARGDLGVECEIRSVPALQKMLLERSDTHGIVCITATQMLESMIAGSMPSRAEASDIFNAILDGTDAAMLSGETAVGCDPAAAVAAMSEIILEAEKYMLTHPSARARAEIKDETFELAICKAAAGAAAEAGAKGIVALTRSGRTALLMSKVEVPVDIPFYALTTLPETFRKMAIYYGVRPVILQKEQGSGDDFWNAVDEALLATGDLKEGDTVVLASGFQVSKGATNVCKIVRLGRHEYY